MKLVVHKGDRYGRLTIVKEVEQIGYRRMFECRCDDGNLITAALCNLRNGHTNSCGCYKVDKAVETNVTHGFSNHPLYVVWCGMIARCYNPNSTRYADYGGRGCRMCDEWRCNAEAFIKWALANGWKSGSELDKDIINPGNKLYCPKYCCFVSPKENNRCTRQTVWVDYNGREMAFGEAHELSGSKVLLVTALNRYQQLGWNLQDALMTPVSTTARRATSKYVLR